jgi:hypothetical protein
MDIRKNDKLKSLLQGWPAHTVMTSRVLKERGLSHSNIANYQKFQWIAPIGRGAFKKASETVSWEGLVYGLQQHEKDTFFVGGKTALELSGSAHFIPFHQATVFLFSSVPKLPPLWFRQAKDSPTFRFHTQRILPPLEGITPYDCGEFSIQISSRERASVEMAALVGQTYAFQDLALIFENLGSMRSNVMQSLLETCTSLKAIRVVLFLGHRSQHPWYNRLDLSRIPIGTGPREVVKGGVYDPQFKITYPKELFEDDQPEI